MWPNPQETVDWVTFTEKSLMKNFILCAMAVVIHLYHFVLVQKKRKKKKSQKATDNPKFCWNLIQLKNCMKNFVTSVGGIANLWLHTFSFRLICGCPFENGGMFNVTLANKSYSKSNPLSAIILSLSSNNEIRPLCFVIYLLNFLSSSIKVKNKKVGATFWYFWYCGY